MSLVVAAVWLAIAAAGAGDSLVRPLGTAEVDWAAGVVRARAGAAADPRLPTPDMARPGAERRARARALDRLRAALKDLPLGAGRTPKPDAIDAALASAAARTAAVDYQSNGGAFVTVELPFEALTGGRDAPDAGVAAAPTLAVTTMPLEAAPVVSCGDREIELRAARYRVEAPPSDARALALRQHRRGRLFVTERQCAELDRLAGVAAVIYVQKVSR